MNRCVSILHRRGTAVAGLKGERGHVLGAARSEPVEGRARGHSVRAEVRHEQPLADVQLGVQLLFQDAVQRVARRAKDGRLLPRRFA
jgi:hypothetical protein